MLSSEPGSGSRLDRFQSFTALGVNPPEISKQVNFKFDPIRLLNCLVLGNLRQQFQEDSTYRPNLLELLIQFRHYRLSKTRDKVYWLLNISAESDQIDGNRIRPSYDNQFSDAECLRVAAITIIKREHDLRILRYANSHDPERKQLGKIPSWVAHWHDDIKYMENGARVSITPGHVGIMFADYRDSAPQVGSDNDVAKRWGTNAFRKLTESEVERLQDPQLGLNLLRVPSIEVDTIVDLETAMEPVDFRECFNLLIQLFNRSFKGDFTPIDRGGRVWRTLGKVSDTPRQSEFFEERDFIKEFGEIGDCVNTFIQLGKGGIIQVDDFGAPWRTFGEISRNLHRWKDFADSGPVPPGGNSTCEAFRATVAHDENVPAHCQDRMTSTELATKVMGWWENLVEPEQRGLLKELVIRMVEAMFAGQTLDDVERAGVVFICACIVHPSSFEGFHGWLQKSYYYRLALTKKGFLALVPRDAQKEDCIVLHPSVKHPFVVRARPPAGRWQLVGTSWIHNMAADKMWQDKQFEEIVFA